MRKHPFSYGVLRTKNLLSFWIHIWIISCAILSTCTSQTKTPETSSARTACIEEKHSTGKQRGLARGHLRDGICECHQEEGGLVSVDCRNRDLTEIPNGLPTSTRIL